MLGFSWWATINFNFLLCLGRLPFLPYWNLDEGVHETSLGCIHSWKDKHNARVLLLTPPPVIVLNYMIILSCKNWKWSKRNFLHNLGQFKTADNVKYGIFIPFIHPFVQQMFIDYRLGTGSIVSIWWTKALFPLKFHSRELINLDSISNIRTH